jgi:hypothetical protein
MALRDFRYPAWRDVPYRAWKPKKQWTSPRDLSDQERQQREEELTLERQREREAWAEEKRRLGL